MPGGVEMNQAIEGLPVPGYRPQAPVAIETVKAVKEIEEQVLRLLDELGDDAELAADKRWLATGRTDIEKGFMAVNRAVFKPERVALAGLDEAIGWLIERADSLASEPLYYRPSHHQAQWTKLSDFALRFARREDAETMASALAVEVRVAEHSWS